MVPLQTMLTEEGDSPLGDHVGSLSEKLAAMRQ